MTTGTARIEEVIEGVKLGNLCAFCKRELRDGERAQVYAYQLAGSPTWTVSRLACRECASEEIAHPTLGAREVLANIRLALTIPGDEADSYLSARETEIVDDCHPEDTRGILE